MMSSPVTTQEGGGFAALFAKVWYVDFRIPGRCRRASLAGLYGRS